MRSAVPLAAVVLAACAGGPSLDEQGAAVLAPRSVGFVSAITDPQRPELRTWCPAVAVHPRVVITADVCIPTELTADRIEFHTSALMDQAPEEAPWLVLSARGAWRYFQRFNPYQEIGAGGIDAIVLEQPVTMPELSDPASGEPVVGEPLTAVEFYEPLDPVRGHDDSIRPSLRTNPGETRSYATKTTQLMPRGFWAAFEHDVIHFPDPDSPIPSQRRIGDPFFRDGKLLGVNTGYMSIVAVVRAEDPLLQRALAYARCLDGASGGCVP